MKIVVTLEKAGQVLAQSELNIDNPRYLKRRTGKAFRQFHKEHPHVSLFEEGVFLKFEKVPTLPRRKRQIRRKVWKFS